MILDCIENWKQYAAGNDAFEKAFMFLLDYIEHPKDPGRYEIDGDRVYAMVSDAVTKTEGVLEAHERYIDIQFLDGDCEKIEYVNRRHLTVKVPYVDDIVFYEDAPMHSDLILGRHDFAVFYPEDAHKPGMAVEQPITIRKVVVKVKV